MEKVLSKPERKMKKKKQKEFFQQQEHPCVLWFPLFKALLAFFFIPTHPQFCINAGGFIKLLRFGGVEAVRREFFIQGGA